MWDQIQSQLDHNALASLAVRLWAHDPHSLRFINLGINVVYRFENKGEGRYLRLTNASLRSLSEVEAATDYLKHFSEQGCEVCKPIASKAGIYIEKLSLEGQDYLATVVQEVPGQAMGVNHTQKQVYETWGYSLGQLHQAAKNYRPPSSLRFLTWQDLWKEITDRMGTVEPELQAVYRAVDQWLQTLPLQDDSFGLTHADFRPGNIFWDGKTASIIDFDEPVYHWFMADIARAMLAFSGHPQRIEFLDWFITGYRQAKPLADFWLDQLQWFMRMKDLDMYTWTLNCWQGPKVPGGDSRDAFLAKTRARLLLPYG
ncbi:MAG: phosphotransferase [Alphaproteobacteria bacterium]|nr:phosphotransferase [Alphaproteobacteria bacterium]